MSSFIIFMQSTFSEGSLWKFSGLRRLPEPHLLQLLSVFFVQIIKEVVLSSRCPAQMFLPYLLHGKFYLFPQACR